MKELAMFACSKISEALNSALGAVQLFWNSTLEPGMKYIYGVYCKQSVAYGISELLTMLLIFTFIAIIWRVINKVNPFKIDSNYKTTSTGRSYIWDDNTAPMLWGILWIAAVVLYAVVAIIVVAICISGIPDLVRHVINPDYYAIQELGELAGKLKP